MVERTSFIDGEPCWADVMVGDLPAARRFYESVFGWTFEAEGPDGGGYTTCLADGARAAAIYPVHPASDDAPSPSWNLYLAAADVDRVARGFTEGGGKLVKGPQDIADAGRMVFGIDPAGSPIGFWQSRQHTGFQRFGVPGGFAWAELNTREPAKSDAFYRQLLSYEQEQYGDGTTFDYTVWNVDGNAVCGRYALPDEVTTLSSGWVAYFMVGGAGGVDAACDRVVGGGGTISRAPEDSPEGRFAIVTDPDGATFGLIDPSQATGPTDTA